MVLDSLTVSVNLIRLVLTKCFIQTFQNTIKVSFKFSKMDRCYARGAANNSSHTVVYRNMAMEKFRPRMDVKKVIT